MITYTLFLVGIALDLTALLMAIPSDWTFAVISRLNEDEADSGSRIDPALNWFLGLKKLRWKKQNCCEGTVEHEVLNTPFLLQRWAGSIKTFNFIAYSVKTDVERIHDTKERTRWRVWKAILLPSISTFRKLCGGNAILIQYIKDVMNQWSGKYPVHSTSFFHIYWQQSHHLTRHQ